MLAVPFYAASGYIKEKTKVEAARHIISACFDDTLIDI
jgi:hypothetical protein